MPLRSLFHWKLEKNISELFLTNHYLPFCLYQVHLRASIVTTTSLTSQIILLTWPFNRMSLTSHREAHKENISTIYNTGLYIFMYIFSFSFF